MSEPLILDTNILADVSRGNTLVADALNRYIRSGTTVYISRAAYDELVTRAPNAQMSGQYREMLSDLRIQIAPSGPMATRVGVYSDNIQINPAPGQPGQIREYDRKNDPTKPGDVFVAAQAKAIDARLWTLDTDIIKRAPQLGVKLAPECETVAQPNRLFVRHIFVVGPMNQQRRRRPRRHPIQRASFDVPSPRRDIVSAQKERQNFGSINAFAVRLKKITGTVAVDHAGHFTGIFGVPALAFELGNTGSHPEKLGQMSPG